MPMWSTALLVSKEGSGLDIRNILHNNQLKSIYMQIMPEVFILGCIYALPAYRDLMRAEGPKHIPIF